MRTLWSDQRPIEGEDDDPECLYAEHKAITADRAGVHGDKINEIKTMMRESVQCCWELMPPQIFSKLVS